MIKNLTLDCYPIKKAGILHKLDGVGIRSKPLQSFSNCNRHGGYGCTQTTQSDCMYIIIYKLDELHQEMKLRYSTGQVGTGH